MDAKALVKHIEKVTDYKNHGPWYPGSQMSNGAYMTSLFNFLEDNPGAIEAILDFMEENGIPESAEDDSECDG